MEKLFGTLILIVLLGFGCSDPGGLLNPDNTGPLTITGDFNDARGISSRSSSRAGDPSDITKVFLFNGSQLTPFPLVNGSFQIPIENFNPSGIIFSNDANEFLGFLEFDESNAIPLQAMGRNAGTLNLGTLMRDSGNGHKYGHNNTNLNTFIQLNDKGRASARVAGSLFSNVIQNLDIPGFSLNDYLNGKRISPTFLYFASYSLPLVRNGSVVTTSISGTTEFNGHRILIGLNSNPINVASLTDTTIQYPGESPIGRNSFPSLVNNSGEENHHYSIC